MGEIVLLLDVWDRRIGRTRWDGGGMEGPALLGAGSGAPTFAIDVRRTAGSGGCHHFHLCCRGNGVFNIWHTNPNCNIVQDSTNRTYYTIVIRTTTKRTNNESVPINNSQKTDDTKIEDSHPL